MLGIGRIGAGGPLITSKSPNELSREAGRELSRELLRDIWTSYREAAPAWRTFGNRDPETRKPPRWGGFGETTRLRDPRPPACTSGTKIASNGAGRKPALPGSSPRNIVS